MTIPLIDAGGLSPVKVQSFDATANPMPIASDGVASFMSAMSHPLAENAALQNALSACVVSLEKASQSMEGTSADSPIHPTPASGPAVPSPMVSPERPEESTASNQPAATKAPVTSESAINRSVEMALPRREVDVKVAEQSEPVVVAGAFQRSVAMVASPVSDETAGTIASPKDTAKDPIVVVKETVVPVAVDEPVAPAVVVRETVVPVAVDEPVAPAVVVKETVVPVAVDEPVAVKKTVVPVAVDEPVAHAVVVKETVVPVAVDEPAAVKETVVPVSVDKPVAPAVAVKETVVPVAVDKPVTPAFVEGADVRLPEVGESSRVVIAPDTGIAATANASEPKDASRIIMPNQESLRLHGVEDRAVIDQPIDGEKSVAADPEKLVAAGYAPVAQNQQVVAPLSKTDAAEVEVVAARTIENVDRVQRVMSASEVLIETARVVADTILVTPGLLRGQGEVRIQLRPEVLDGTEVRIVATGRHLEVEFIPTVQDAAVMIERCRPQFEQHLAERIHAFAIAVKVSPNVAGARVGRARRKDEEVS